MKTNIIIINQKIKTNLFLEFYLSSSAFFFWILYFVVSEHWTRNGSKFLKTRKYPIFLFFGPSSTDFFPTCPRPEKFGIFGVRVRAEIGRSVERPT